MCDDRRRSSSAWTAVLCPCRCIVLAEDVIVIISSFLMSLRDFFVCGFFVFQLAASCTSPPPFLAVETWLPVRRAIYSCTCAFPAGFATPSVHVQVELLVHYKCWEKKP